MFLGDPVSIGHAYTRRGSVPCENQIAVEVDLAEIGQFSVIGREGPVVFDLELLFDVGQPS